METPDILKDTKHLNCQPGQPCAVIPVPPHDCPPGCDCELGAGYLRVSAIMKREELLSPELQAHDIGIFARLRKIRIVKMVCDINKTGTEFTQRRVGEMIDDIKRRDYTQVVMLNWDRWGRDEPESQLYLRRLRDAGGTVRAAAEDFDIETDVGELTVGQLLLIAQFRSRQISKGWKRVGAKRLREGLPHTGKQMFGYTYSKAEGYKIHPEQGPLLKDAYERMLAGQTLRSLAAAFSAKGFTTTQGNPWSLQALTRVMDTGFAAGLIRGRSKPRKASQGGARTIKEYDLWHKGAHEPIIDMDTWERYKAKREASALQAPRLRVAAHALSGLLYCDLCATLEEDPRETRLVSVYSGKYKKHQWVCPRARDLRTHRFTGVSNANAMEAVLTWVSGQVGEYDVTEEAQRLATAEAASVSVAALEGEMARLVKKRKNVANQLTDEKIEQEDADEQLAQIKADLANVEASLAAARALQVSSGGDRIRAFTTLREEWGRFQPHDHREALAALVRKIMVVPSPDKGGRATLKPIEVWES